MPGDQGVFNYVLNRAARRDAALVALHPLMRWPGVDTSDVTVADVARGPASPHRQVMHWAGFKGSRLGDLPRADLLRHFERRHYAMHGGPTLRQLRAAKDVLQYEARRLSLRLRQRLARIQT